MDFEYACTNGIYIIGEPGTLAHARGVKAKNVDEARRIGDRARFNYRVVRRTSSNKLKGRPGKWQEFEIVDPEGIL